jgi:Uma2 family endonuclease
MSIGIVDDLRDGVEVHLAPLSVRQYQQMIRDGILLDGEPIELIQGALLYKDRRDQTGGIMTHGPRHLRAVNKLTAILSQWVASRQAFLQVQGPIVVSDTSEPEPDCTLVRGKPDDYADAVPHATAVLAVFEIAYSSLPSDRRTKRRLYATAGIPVYVIVNLQDNVIEVMSEPSTTDASYVKSEQHQSSETVTLSLEECGELVFQGSDLF